MGMFKDMRDLSKAGKEMKKERGGSLKMMKDGLAQANQAVQEVQADQALAEKLANEGVDGTATIIQMVATGATINMQPELQFQMTVDVGGNVSTSPTPRSSPPRSSASSSPAPRSRSRSTRTTTRS